MQTTKLISLVTLALLVALGLAWEGTAQDTISKTQAAQPGSSSPVTMTPEASKVWNSPQMVKARKWLDDYLRVTAEMTPKEKAAYKNELEHLTASQMKLWLLKFNHEEQQRQQQYQAWQQAHQASMQHALAYQQANRQALSNVSKDETAAAQEEQKQLETQQRQASEMQQSKLDDLNAPYYGGAYPYSPYGAFGLPYYGGMGGVHYHVHVYPGGE